MKKDKYLKVILTIIAICLVWICVRDIKIGSNEVYAKVNSGGQEDVTVNDITDAVWSAIQLSLPIQVRVTNWPYSPQPEEK